MKTEFIDKVNGSWISKSVVVLALLASGSTATALNYNWNNNFFEPETPLIEIDWSLLYSNPFIMKVKTSNPGVSSNNQFRIPTTGGGYNYNVDCNSDGVIEASHLTGDYTCNYSSPGSYTVTISGAFPQIYFERYYLDTAGGYYFPKDNKKLTSIEQWGTQKWRSMHGAFEACSNMVSNATDKPDLSIATDMSRMFDGATKFNSDINNWDVSNIVNMNYTFYSATSFDQYLGDWKIDKVNSMHGMFGGVTLSTDNYERTLYGWLTKSYPQNNVYFDGGNSKYHTGLWARYGLISYYNWHIFDGGSL